MPLTIESMQPRLVFVIGAPRSGTTLLLRMLGSHSAIYTRPEPHLLTPLAHLGYYATVDAAPFDHLQAAQAARELVADLPRGEQDYLDACRAYTDLIYGRMLAAHGHGKQLFVDKTPANALILPFLTKLYPQAHYLVLLRHPAAIFSSYANSFFDGDYEAARRFNPILNRYVPAMARLLRDAAVPLLAVRYEQLVQDPAGEMQRICSSLGLEFQPGMIDYGQHTHATQGLGDPITVDRQTGPVTDSVDTWSAELAQSAEKRRVVQEMVAAIDDRDLETWGHPRATFFAPVETQTRRDGAPRLPARLDRFRLQRKVLVRLRRNIHQNAFGRLVRRVRMLCDVLLRG